MSLVTFSRRVLSKVFNHGVTTARKPAAVLGQSSSRGYNTTWAPWIPGPGRASRVRLLDLRSDAVTPPGPAMRQAMAEAELGDDLMRDGPSVEELQKIAADMFQMEAALLVPSGTMGNLIAVMVHCRQRDDELIVGDLSHIHLYEQGGTAQLAGVHATTVTTLPDGSFDLDQLESKIRHGYPGPHYARSRLICLENTHNVQGGRVLPLTFLKEVRAFADKYGLSVYMDGARLMNAAVAQRVPPSTILQHTHSVTVSLSKGLGAPMGSMLAGPRDFIFQAERCRQALGGKIRKTGMMAAAGKLSLLEMMGRMEEDHRNAKVFAQALFDCDPPLFSINLAAVETNILRFHLKDPRLSPSEFCTRMGQVGVGEEAALGQGIQVLMLPYFGNSVRAVWHLGISREDTQLAIQKMQFVVSQYLQTRES